jgi:hypothetical protein
MFGKALLLLLCAPPLAAAPPINVAPADHIPNEPPGLCAWAATETACLTNGWHGMRGLTARNRKVPVMIGAHGCPTLCATLDRHGVPYRVQVGRPCKPGCRWDVDFLTGALSEGRCAVVAVPEGDIWHVVVVVSMDERECQLIDSNFPPGQVRKMPRAEFMKGWNGFTLVVGRNRQ